MAQKGEKREKTHLKIFNDKFKNINDQIIICRVPSLPIAMAGFF